MSAPAKVDVAAKLALIVEHWRPKVIAELNGQEVKLAKFAGDFVWHRHEHADELFLGVAGSFRVEFRDRSETIGPGQLIVVPRGVEHRTVADQEAAALIFEPAATRNTGDVVDARLTAPNGARV
ncbi:MAG: cupin domain-containing protein [Planctomycetes bacterium]|nr:cupin domain-containing protein [Planctomycetota bacterium]